MTKKIAPQRGAVLPTLILVKKGVEGMKHDDDEEDSTPARSGATDLNTRKEKLLLKAQPKSLYLLFVTKNTGTVRKAILLQRVEARIHVDA